ncbi:hypothetical protein STANM309S_01482 [Streptomyces tanashiensis]
MRENAGMLELSILGFLYETPLHGYELRKRITALTGHVRPVGESTLYPAIKRLEKAGLLVRESQPGPAAAPRQVLTLTPAGRDELRRRLADAEGPDVTDENRWFTLLAFLRHLDDPDAQAAVLRRRLTFLEDARQLLLRRRAPLARRGPRRATLRHGDPSLESPGAVTLPGRELDLSTARRSPEPRCPRRGACGRAAPGGPGRWSAWWGGSHGRAEFGHGPAPAVGQVGQCVDLGGGQVHVDEPCCEHMQGGVSGPLQSKQR